MGTVVGTSLWLPCGLGGKEEIGAPSRVLQWGLRGHRAPIEGKGTPGGTWNTACGGGDTSPFWHNAFFFCLMKRVLRNFVGEEGCALPR